MKKIIVALVASIFMSYYTVSVAQQLAGQFGNYTIAKKEGLYGLVNNLSNDTVLPCEYNYVCSSLTFPQGIIIRKRNNCLIFNPIDGTTLKPKDILPINRFDLYALPIRNNAQYGFVDGDGNVKIEGQWDFALDFKDSLARVVDNNGINKYLSSLTVYPSQGKTGYINIAGDYAISPSFSYVDMFSSEKFRVTRFSRAPYDCDNDMGCENPYKLGKWGLINDRGEIVLQDNTYDFIDRGFIDSNSNELVFLVEQKGLKGIINYKGDLIYPLSQCSSFEELWKKYITKEK